MADLTLSGFLARTGDTLAEGVRSRCRIVHDPFRDRDPELDRRLAGLRRACLPAQAEAAKALAKAFFQEGQRAVYLCGELGTGKTQIALALLALAPRPLRALVVCPPHLVPKWRREAETVLPAVRVVDLGGPDALQQLLALHQARRTDRLRGPEVPEVWVLGRERAKLHHGWKPAFFPRLRARREDQRLLTWREPACLTCGAILADPEGLPLPVEALGTTRAFCQSCHEPAWSAAPPRRYAPAEFIKRHLKGTFDLYVADEVHEAKAEHTGNGATFGALAASCRRTLALTGTLLGGYADHLFFLLWRSHPQALQAEGFQYHGVKAWMERYGVLERVTRIRHDEDARVVRGKSKPRTLLRRKPGISPLILGRHLLPTTLFLRLADVAEGLPPYEERVVSLAMSQPLAEAYRGLEQRLLAAVRQALREGSRKLLGRYLQALLCYPDEAAVRGETVTDPDTHQVLASAPPVPGPLPKEEELVELCLKEAQQGRRVLVYAVFTETRDLTPRLKALLEGARLRVAVLKGSVEPTRREAWIQARVTEGVEVLIANPELVKTGLDLYDFPTFVFYETGYSIYTLRQAARRAWRIGQTQPCRVVFLAYRDTLQERALTLIATKLEASLMLEGELSEAGLTALADTADSLTVELARALVDQVTDEESAEAVWARLRKQELTQLLTLTAFRPEPALQPVTETITQIGDRLLLVDLLEAPRPRAKRVARVEVSAGKLEELLSQQPGLAQLALF